MQTFLCLFAAAVFLTRYASPNIVWFVILSVICIIAYPTLHLRMFKDTTYRSIVFERKMYVLSNTIKGMTLCACCPISMFLLYECLHGIWNTRQILMLGHIYTVLDMVSLFMLERMQTSTMVHHVAVVLVHLQNCIIGFDTDTYARCSVIYAIFSCFAFQVNLTLAKRYEDTSYRSAYLSYILCCMCNWTWQIYYTATHPFSWHGVLWWAFMIAIIYDDVHLILWLHQKL